MSFEFFDRQEDYVVRQGNLPHWYQPGVTYFITFRTEDSVPQALLRSWYARRDDWLRRHGIDPTSSRQTGYPLGRTAAADRSRHTPCAAAAAKSAVPLWRQKLRETPTLQAEFDALFTQEFMEYLDRGYGECVLRDGRLSKIVADSLQFFAGERYHLGDFVVMPNHVHLLCCLIGSTEIEPQCRSWKKYTAMEINAALGRKGRFWQEESFDHLVRGPDEFEYFQTYIAENPEKARLKVGEYIHWRPKT